SMYQFYTPPSCVLLIFCHLLSLSRPYLFLFFFNAPPTTEIYTLSLHDALPIYLEGRHIIVRDLRIIFVADENSAPVHIRATKIIDRKSTRLNSSHDQISYAVFCLKKKNKK